MRQAKRLVGGGAVLVLLLAGAALADPDHDELIVNGEIEMIVRAPAPPHVENLDEIISGWSFRTDETQALQMDDFDNPGMLGVERALVMFDTPMGTAGQACSSCHETPEALRGVRATYPKWDEERQTVQTVEMQVNECLTERMGAEPLGYDSTEMVDMSALIASVSRGMVVDVAIDGPAQSTWEKGREMYYTRFGQLELACANCHEDNAGRMIRADHLSQGQINGFPAYRLNNAALISVHNRFRGCIRDTRAETFEVGSPEFVALELYVASRGNGLTVEGPSVRN
ncbi:sulfur oxidation c-type cytochrome SoxA [Rubellimicrobium sp. CFH 75288]|uniref:sulfur oxidation c-type cytochrome SoxA n=1 Tax=Rubellimicrobium sp. CFH 75288 TaxID=2697034 RepID=UPI0014122FE8|nr:sulfur oxidation c-type cytochrome SoxA [Rubellimicrobium sp. CFH 75288]NAZ35688.1 sulfur oxidation c-type cytochrome SoxA [Rubellimicrobium sp. CFH 75288]